MITALPARLMRSLFVDGYRGPVAFGSAVALVTSMPLLGLAAAALVLAPVWVVGTALMVALPDGLRPSAVAAAAGVAYLLAFGVLAHRDRHRIGAPGNSALVGCALVCAAFLTAFSLPVYDTGTMTVALAGALLLPAVWFAREIRADRRERPAVVGRRRWAVVPLLVAATAGLLVADVPKQARFALGRPALTAFVERTAADPAVPSGELRGFRPEWIGPYRVTVVDKRPEGVHLHIDSGNLIEGTGFAHLPNGPTAGSRNTYTHLSGPWYTWRDHQTDLF
ncbi:hypothetical protein ACWGB8_18845 [Kitasatospora sp. NPDC054939]